MYPVLEEFQKIGIIPVVVLNDAKDAKPLAGALMKGGLPCAGIHFPYDHGGKSLSVLCLKAIGLLVGALFCTTEQVDRAVAAGAKFIVNPGLNPKL